MRRTSVSLPTRNVDPHEKPARYNSNKDLSVHRAGILDNLKAAWMTQSQRSRYVKTGGILLFIVFLFYFLAPTGTNVHLIGTLTVFSRSPVPLIVLEDTNICLARW